MRKLWKTSIAVLLTAVTLLGCVACTVEPSINESTTTVDETTAEIHEELYIIKGGRAEYTLIYPASSDAQELAAVDALKNNVMSNTGAQLSSENDKISNGQARAEILIGATNRAETAKALENVGGNGFVIAMIGNKLVIAGSSPMLTRSAVDHFCKNLVSESVNLKLVDNYLYAVGGDSTLSLKKDGRVNIVRSLSSSEAVKSYAYGIKDGFEKLGSSVALKNDNAALDDALTIIVGKTALPESKYVESLVGTSQFAVISDGNRVVLLGSDDYCSRRAVSYFKENFINEAGELSMPSPFKYVCSDVYFANGDDPHKVTENADLSALNTAYAGLNAYTGDLHAHSSTGPNGDGSVSLADLKKQAATLGIDFMLIADHRQTTHPFDNSWDREFFMSATEPGTTLTDGYKSNMHYIIAAPTPDAYKSIIKKFAKLFNYAESIGTFIYPSWTSAQFAELAEYTRSVGGFIIICHPAQLFTPETVPVDPLYWYYGDGSLFEVLYMSDQKERVETNYRLWSGLLMEGKKVYCSAATDTHSAANSAVLNTLFASSTQDSALTEAVHKGNFVAGEAEIKMFLNGSVMGASVESSVGDVLQISVENVKNCKSGNYKVTVYTDQGIAYQKTVAVGGSLRLELEVQDREFYRVEITNESGSRIYGLGQPIWLD